MPPVIPKNTKGHSWPSRHVFSATIIALTFFPVNMPLAIVLLVCAAGIAVIRVISGVHSISDVVAAAACALLFSGYFF